MTISFDMEKLLTEHPSAARRNCSRATADVAEGKAFGGPRRAAQEKTWLLRDDLPHSMRPSLKAEFPRRQGRRAGKNDPELS
jgi:hypothetical protein